MASPDFSDPPAPRVPHDPNCPPDVHDYTKHYYRPPTTLTVSIITTTTIPTIIIQSLRSSLSLQSSPHPHSTGYPTCNDQCICRHSTDGYSRLRVMILVSMMIVCCRLSVVGVSRYVWVGMITPIVPIRGLRGGIAVMTPISSTIGDGTTTCATPIPLNDAWNGCIG